MQPGNRPQNLRDISHLYLSTSPSPRGDSIRSSALVLLAAMTRGPWRAYLSAGLAAAFESHGAIVTLLETGPGFPCAGYYFALEPERYLRSALDAGLIVKASAGRSISMLYARDPSLLDHGKDNQGTSGRPGVILLAFDWSAGDDRGSLGKMLDSIPALAASGTDAKPGWVDLPAFLLTASESGPFAIEGVVRDFRSLFPEGPGMCLYPQRYNMKRRDGDEANVDPCPFPDQLSEGLARRVPPSSDFLSGVAGEILQRLGSRKKNGGRHGT